MFVYILLFCFKLKSYFKFNSSLKIFLKILYIYNLTILIINIIRLTFKSMLKEQIVSQQTPTYLYIIFVVFLIFSFTLSSILLYQWKLYPELRGIHFNFICLMAACQLMLSLCWLILIILNFSLDVNFIQTTNKSSNKNKYYCPISTSMVYFPMIFLFYCSIIITFLNLYAV